MGILEIKDLSLSIDGTQILDDINIEVWEGYVHAIVGPNGAGKSSLANTIMGLEGYCDVEGDIIFEGESIVDLNVDERGKRGITLAWQEPARFEGVTIDRFIKAAAKDSSDQKVNDCLEKVGMDPDRYMGRAVDTSLSGGERKKVELASILAMDPDLVLLDEPDSGIDVESLEKIFEALEYLKENGSTVILITHSAEVLKHAEHAFLMCCGSILDKGSEEKIDDYFENQCIPCDHKNKPDKEEGEVI